MPTILIGGYYGAGNVGDEAILEAMVGELRAQRPDLDFLVTSWDPDKTSRDLKVSAFFWKDINALIDAALKADLIILGGGGLFHDYWGIDPDTYLRKAFWDITAFGSLPLLARLLDVPCMIYAVGVGPLQSDLAREHTRLAFERCQAATLRDHESLEILRQTGFNVEEPGRTIEVLADAVFSFSTQAEEEHWADAFLQDRRIDRDTPLLGVSLLYWDRGGKPEEWLPRVAEGVRLFLEKNGQFQLIGIPFQVLEATPFTNDAIILKELGQQIGMPQRTHIIEHPLTPRLAQALIGRCSLLLGMRLHSLIMGINNGIPVVALSRAPKISSLMSRFGLDRFCLPIAGQPQILASELQAGWDQRPALSTRLRILQQEARNETARHARLALTLLSRSRRKPLSFAQQFALHQTRLLIKADDELQPIRNDKEYYQAQLTEVQSQLGNARALCSKQEEENLALHAHISDLGERLREIESSRFVKLARAYYRLAQARPLRPVERFLSRLKRTGARQAVGQVIEESRADKEARQVRRVVSLLNARELGGVFVVTSAFVFDKFYNQRVINLSKFLARQGCGVIYVAWRWLKDDPMPDIGREVYPNIFQVPVDMFLENLPELGELQHPRKYFVAEFPHPNFLTAALELKRYGFPIIYEIIDEWEEFHKVGQSPWFEGDVEKALVVNANLLTAISPPLIEKFSDLRSDIHLLPNGYDPSILGRNSRNIARHHFERPKVHAGYFGHLTDSWFDWDLLLRVLDLAKDHGMDLHIHIIGYGSPSLEEKLSNYRDRLPLHGKVKPADLSRYAQEWDIAMIPFRPGKLSEAVDPLKVYEYLYFGLPVIVTGITHLGRLPRVRVARDAAEFLEALSAFKEEAWQHPAAPDTHRAVARLLEESTWEQRFARLLSLLETEQWMPL